MPEKQATPDQTAGGRKLLSRRTVLSRGAIAGALGVGVAMAGGAGALGTLSGQASSALPANLTAAHFGPPSGPIVIYLADPRSDEVEIFAGTTRVRRTDPSLAARVKYLAPRH